MDRTCSYCGKREPRWVLVDHRIVLPAVDPFEDDWPRVCEDCVAGLALPRPALTKREALHRAAVAANMAEAADAEGVGQESMDADSWRRTAFVWIAIAHETGYE